MPSRKNLKKQINELTYEVVSDCFTYLTIHEEKNRQKVLDIITEMVKYRNELIHRVNNYDKIKTPKEIKSHYRKIKKDLLSAMDKSFLKLSKLSQK